MPTKPTVPINQSQLYKISAAKLYSLLGLTRAEFRELTETDNLYSEFKIEKKNGSGFRTVENPARRLKVVQAKIARLLSRITPPDFLYCPVKKRCYVSNATAHAGNRVVHCLDIKKFFPSTPRRQVYWFFHKVMKCETDIAAKLANIACYQGHLPTGSPLSPIMAYFSYYDLWAKISEFCKARGYTFTVYIDDITISGKKVPERDIFEIRKMIYSSGLRYHKQKKYVDRPAEVTGNILRDGKILPPNRQLKKLYDLRQLFSRTADEEERKKLMSQIAGVKGQLAQIRAKSPAPPI